MYGFWWGNLKENKHLEDPDIDWRTKLMLILKQTAWNCVDYIHMIVDMNMLWAVLNMVTNLQVP